MPQGSRPGEHRGGRQRGTPNKSTALKNAAFIAAVADPKLTPLDFFLSLMRQANLPLQVRIDAAQQALPLAHRKPKPANETYGRSGTVANKKIGPRVKLMKVAADADPDGITPLDFLLGVMRDAKNDPALRLRAAGLVAPYLHAKGGPNEAPGEMRVVDDYGFGSDIGDIQKSIHQDQEQLSSAILAVPHPTAWTDRQDVDRWLAAYENAGLEFKNSIAEKQSALKCPPTYKELDSRQDRARLAELEAEGRKRPLTAAEEHEQKHLHGRLAAYALTPQSADCKRMNFLKAFPAELFTAEEKEELKTLEARYPDVPLDRTCMEEAVFLARVSIRQLLRAPQS
jgi:hypothetical protein